jgi:hypothetical protein
LPCVRISTGLWAKGCEMRRIEAVQAALVSAFRIPEGDGDIVLDLYDPERRIVSAGRSERYTRVEIVGIAARSDGAKRALFAAVVDRLELAGVQPWRLPRPLDTSSVPTFEQNSASRGQLRNTASPILGNQVGLATAAQGRLSPRQRTRYSSGRSGAPGHNRTSSPMTA